MPVGIRGVAGGPSVAEPLERKGARTVREGAATRPTEAWTRQTIKEGSQGPMVAECATLRRIAVRDAVPGPEV